MDDRSVVIGYALGYNDGLADSGEPQSDNWQPPADWLEVPEPGAWEANFLIEIRNVMMFTLAFWDPQNGYGGYGNVTIDWGDGTVETYAGYSLNEYGYPQGTRRDDYHAHTYAQQGQYIVKAVTDEMSCFLAKISDNRYIPQNVNLLIAKTGKKICLDKHDGHDSNGTFQHQYRLSWLKIDGNSKMQTYGVYDCGSLKRLDLAEPMTEIPTQCFLLTPIPKNFDFSKIEKIGERGFSQAALPQKIVLPECTEIGLNAFNSNIVPEEIYAPKCVKILGNAFSSNRFLKKVSAPLCTSVEATAFDTCTALYSAEFSEDCVFGTNCFRYCYSLYPRPDGSTN